MMQGDTIYCTNLFAAAKQDCRNTPMKAQMYNRCDAACQYYHADLPICASGKLLYFSL